MPEYGQLFSYSHHCLSLGLLIPEQEDLYKQQDNNAPVEKHLYDRRLRRPGSLGWSGERNNYGEVYKSLSCLIPFDRTAYMLTVSLCPVHASGLKAASKRFLALCGLQDK